MGAEPSIHFRGGCWVQDPPWPKSKLSAINIARKLQTSTKTCEHRQLDVVRILITSNLSKTITQNLNKFQTTTQKKHQNELACSFLIFLTPCHGISGGAGPPMAQIENVQHQQDRIANLN